MPADDLTVDVIARGDLMAALRGTREWRRGERTEAVRRTAVASAGSVFDRFSAWLWTGTTPWREPVWVVPVRARHAMDFHPARPADALARLIAAAVAAGAHPRSLRLERWDEVVCMIVPGAGEEIAALAVEEALAGVASHVDVKPLPDGVEVFTEALPLPPFTEGDGTGLVGLARRTGLHPAEAALALTAHGVPVDAAGPAHAGSLREWGVARRPIRVPPRAPSLAIDDDPCPRRRHARRVLRRLFHMRKIGSQYHTEFDHLYRGAPPEMRREALEVGEALVRAGLLGEKPSVGQRHVYLRREALPDIHALMARGETRSPALAALWSAPQPGAALTGPPPPSRSR